MVRHLDSDRTIVFGDGAVAAAGDALAPGYHLLTTDRALAMEPGLAEQARAVTMVPPGLVEQVSAALAPEVEAGRIVALGGGRVIDVAKAVASVSGAEAVIAVPTTLSGAEMTRHHRLPVGAPAGTARVRPSVVINDPALSASAPEHLLAASSANALAHGVAAAVGTPAGSRTHGLGIDAVTLLASAWDGASPDRHRLARGAMLAGWAVDHAGLGPHHAIAQEAARGFGVPHASANAAVLPATIRALRERSPHGFAPLDEAVPELDAVAVRLRDIGAVDAPNNAWLQDEVLERVLDAVMGRPELGTVTPPLGRCDVRAIYTEAAMCEALLA